MFLHLRIGSRPGCLLLFSWLSLLIANGPARADFVITEFAASNNSAFVDEDGDESDWIEIYNSNGETTSLAGWFLTDNAGELRKWQFPDVSIPGRGFLVVFASGKDRATAGGELHTNFKLDNEGEYLALVRPDGVTTVSAFAPEFPRQVSGLTYGRRIVVENDWPAVAGQARLIAPEGADAPAGWKEVSFDDQGWEAVGLPVGYDRPDLAEPEPTDPLVDVTAPGDFIQATSLNSPLNEEVDKAIDDNSATKYLNFDKLNAGFTVLPSVGATVVSGLRFTSANDAPERDPTSFVLSGSNDGETFTEIASGSIPAFSGRFTTVEVNFDNEVAFREYRLIFPTVVNAGAAVAMQIAEVEFLGRMGGPAVEFSDLISSDVEELMLGRTPTAYLRIPFTVNEPGPFANLALRMLYEDGFVAWLNGVEVARANPGVPDQSSTAGTNRLRSAAVQAEVFDLSDWQHLIVQGANMLAVQGFNEDENSADFLLDARLENRQLTLGESVYFEGGTPGVENGASVAGIVADVIVNPGRGFYETPVIVAMTCATEGAVIRYTLDGSAPTASTGTLYTGPITIDHTITLRASAFTDGWWPATTVTHSYIFLDDVIQQTHEQTLAAGFPSDWNGQPADYGLDPRVVGQSDDYGGKYRASLKEDLQSLPTMSIVMNIDDMFGSDGIYSNPNQRGDAWERPVSLELIYPGRPGGFQENAGIRIQGGAFRRFDLTLKKSFRVVFREEYGKGMLDFPLFGEGAAEEFNNFILRANSNDAWPYAADRAVYVRDAWAMETVREMGRVSSHTDFVHLYINGFYWGLYNPVERPDAGFSSSYFGGEREDWDAINQDSAPDGTYEAWNRLLDLANQGLADNERYQFIQGNNPDGTRNPAYDDLVDIENMIDYMIMNLYVGNTDWPHRNWWAGRNREGGDGFKFFPWDTETALGFTSINTDRTGVNGAVATVYAAARANADFRMQFADQVHQHFSEGGALYVDPANPAWDPEHPERNRPAARFAAWSEYVRRAVVGESARWGDQLRASPYTRDEDWAVERDRMLSSYFPQRSAIVLEQFRGAGLYPNTEAPTMNQRGGQVAPGFQLELMAPAGTIFYTTNGTDPRSPVIVEELSRTTLTPREAPKRVLVPSTVNGGSSLGTTWRETSFNDNEWTPGSGGIGYDRDTTYAPHIQTDVRAMMENQNTSILVRIPFTYDGEGLERLNFMVLRMQYDDGFAAFLNGVLIASANAPGALPWNAAATAQNQDSAAVQFEEFNADAGLGALRAGENVLAIHGLNIGLSSSDFLLAAELVVGERLIEQSPNDAMVYTGPITVTDGMQVKTRAFAGDEWSALEEGTFIVGTPDLQVSELNYHPADPTAEEVAAGFLDDNDFEFIELYNNGTAGVDLSGFEFTTGIQFEFADPGPRILPGEYLLVVLNRAAFEFRYGSGLPIAGEYSGRFDNSGERIVLVNGSGEPVIDFSYGTEAPWPQAPDGGGRSLERTDLAGSPGLPESWQASESMGGSPGEPSSVAAPNIQLVEWSGASLRLTFPGQAGRRYTIMASDTLAPESWTAVQAGSRLTQNETVEMEVPIEPGAGRSRFFRLAVD